MADCKYPNEVCANMTVLNGNTYCDSVPCSLKDELPKQTNADRIRAMSDEELADMLHNIGSYVENEEPKIDIYIGENKSTIDDSFGFILEWLQSEAE